MPPYRLDAGKYWYVVVPQTNGETIARCTHKGTGVTAERRHRSQYVARQLARLRVERIFEEEDLVVDELHSARQRRMKSRPPTAQLPLVADA